MNKTRKNVKFNNKDKETNDYFLNMGIPDKMNVVVTYQEPPENMNNELTKEQKEQNRNDRLKNEKKWTQDYKNEMKQKNNPSILKKMKDFIMPNKKKLELKSNTNENEIMNADPTLKNLTLIKPMSEDEFIIFRKALKDIKNYELKLDDFEYSKRKYDEDRANFIKMLDNKELTKTEEVDKNHQLKYDLEELQKKANRIKEIERNKTIIEKDYYPDRENREYFVFRNYKNKTDGRGSIPEYGIAYRNRTNKGGKRNVKQAKKTRKAKNTRKARKRRYNKNKN
jgi:hypothetical protein